MGRSLADPLNGASLGKQLETDLQSRKRGKLRLSLAAIPLFTKSGATRVRIVLNYPSKFYTDDCTARPIFVGLLGIIYTKGGNSVQRFSDLTSHSTGTLYPALPVLDFLVTGLSGPCQFATPYRYETQTALPPGEYKLRVVLSDGKKFGRVEVPLTVNNYDRQHLGISGIVLARRYRQAPSDPQEDPTVLPQNYAPLISKGVIVTPTANTHFEKGGPFCFYVEIFKPRQPGSPQRTTVAHMKIVDAKTGNTVKQLDPINAASYAIPGNPVIPIRGGIDITALPKGSYLLEVQATDSAGESTPWRSANFTIE